MGGGTSLKFAVGHPDLQIVAAYFDAAGRRGR
jgi:hypothetical protein